MRFHSKDHVDLQAMARGVAPPVIGWWRPVSARLHREGQNEHLVDWVVVDLAESERRPEPDTDGLLARFVGLDVAPPGRILDFARKYGLPLDPNQAWKQFPMEKGEQWGTPISTFHTYASLLKATLRVHSRLQARDGVEVSDVQTVRKFLKRYALAEDARGFALHEYGEHDAPPAGTANLNRWRTLQGARVAGVINWWLERGRVHPRLVVFPTGRSALRWTGGLWGALGGQLIYAVRQEERVAVCDYCHKEFQLQRRPRTGAQTRCCEKLKCRREYGQDRTNKARGR